MPDLASLADKIETAERALQQDAAEAARFADERERSAFQFCRRLIAIIRVVLDQKKTAFPDSGWRVIVMSLLVKTIATVRAAHTLAAAGHGREISIIVRSALESLITAMFIAKKDGATRAKRWAQHAVVTKARLLKKYPNLSSKPEHKKITRRILAHAKRLEKAFPNPLFWASGLKKGSLRDLANDVDMVWYYDVVYWSGSQGTHASPIAVDSYLGVAAVGEPSYKLGLSLEHLRGELAVCCDILVRALKLLNDSGKLGLDTLLGELVTEHKSAFGGDPLADMAEAEATRPAR
jgi:Family of unknown function (DUF5677)